MKKLAITALITTSIITLAHADKAGFYAGAGISASAIMSDNDFVDRVFDGEQSVGWRLEGGYIWDLGKPGGFHLGAAGLYNNFGTFNGDVIGAQIEAQALSALVVLEQEITNWVDFVFKTGFGAMEYEYGDDLGLELGVIEPSLVVAFGFVFFPAKYLGIELLAETSSFKYEYRDCDYYGCYSPDSDCVIYGSWGEICYDEKKDSSYTILALSASLQYRF